MHASRTGSSLASEKVVVPEGEGKVDAEEGEQDDLEYSDGDDGLPPREVAGDQCCEGGDKQRQREQRQQAGQRECRENKCAGDDVGDAGVERASPVFLIVIHRHVAARGGAEAAADGGNRARGRCERASGS